MITSFIIRYLGWQAGIRVVWPRPATIRSLGCSRKMRPLAFLDPSAFIATNPEPPTLVSECDFFVQFWRTRKGPNQFADATRDAE